MTNDKKTCQNCKMNFALDATDLGFYEKMGVPPPALCPECRFKRRAVYRNERMLYKSVCKLCGASVITMYHPASPYTVYCNDCWASDKWDPATYVKEYDPIQPFFDQLGELTRKVSKTATYSSSSLGPNINAIKRKWYNFGSGITFYSPIPYTPNSAELGV